jgi:hypothetical protein
MVWAARPDAHRTSATLFGAMVVSRHDDDTPMTVRVLLRHPAGFLPVAMSVGALAMIVWFVSIHGVEHQHDESTQARIWQLLVAGQVPLIAYAAARWIPTARRPALVVLAAQLAAVALLAIGPLWVLGGL